MKQIAFSYSVDFSSPHFVGDVFVILRKYSVPWTASICRVIGLPKSIRWRAWLRPLL